MLVKFSWEWECAVVGYTKYLKNECFYVWECQSSQANFPVWISWTSTLSQSHFISAPVREEWMEKLDGGTMGHVSLRSAALQQMSERPRSCVRHTREDDAALPSTQTKGTILTNDQHLFKTFDQSEARKCTHRSITTESKQLLCLCRHIWPLLLCRGKKRSLQKLHQSRSNPVILIDDG